MRNEYRKYDIYFSEDDEKEPLRKQFQKQTQEILKKQAEQEKRDKRNKRISDIKSSLLFLLILLFILVIFLGPLIPLGIKAWEAISKVGIWTFLFSTITGGLGALAAFNLFFGFLNAVDIVEQKTSQKWARVYFYTTILGIIALLLNLKF